MMRNTRYTRICWYDWVGNLQHSKWYREEQATEQALAACRICWPDLKFWKEEGHPYSVVELTIQDMLEHH